MESKLNDRILFKIECKSVNCHPISCLSTLRHIERNGQERQASGSHKSWLWGLGEQWWWELVIQAAGPRRVLVAAKMVQAAQAGHTRILSLSALSGRKLRQNHGARLGQGGLCSQRCCHQPRARAAKVSLLPSRYAFSELDRIIDTCRGGWSLDGIWNNEIMTTLARSDRHWMNHADFLLLLSLNLTFRLQVWMRQLVRWPVSERLDPDPLRHRPTGLVTFTPL